MASPTRFLVFGPFRLFPEQRRLFEGDQIVAIGDRALDLLGALAEVAGETLSHEDLMAVAWPRVTVDPISLRVHISRIRRVLGHSTKTPYIVSVSGRGYRFVAPVESRTTPALLTTAADSDALARAPKVLGREAIIETLIAQIPCRPLVTIVAGGGMGKTAIARAVSERMREQGARVISADLSLITQPEMLASAIAAALGAPLSPDPTAASLARFAADLEAVLMLDSGEHVIDALAPLVEGLRASAPGLHVVVTSREPLRAVDEWLVHVPPLDCPAETDVSDELLAASSVQLFLDRALAADDRLEVSAENLAIIGAICRRLEGIPLAIELVATRIDLFGLQGLYDNLDDRFLLLARGRRTALPRQQTMRATLDWSYELLSQTERRVLRRLAVFQGVFTLAQALKIAADDEVSELDVLEGLPSLAQRSMISRAEDAGESGYRFFSVNRFYAFERLISGGEGARIRRRHAAYLLTMFEQAEAAWPTLPRSAWIGRFQPKLGDVRSALEWAFGEGGDALLGARLAAAWVPIGIHLGLSDEFDHWTKVALETVERHPSGDTKLEFAVRLAVNLVQSLARGWMPAVTQDVETTLDLAEREGDASMRRDALMHVFVAAFGDARYKRAMEVADRLRQTFTPNDDAFDRLSAERMFAQASHFLGRHDLAEPIARELIAYPRTGLKLSTGSQLNVDWRVSMRIVLSRILWLRGKADEALAVAQDAVTLAEGDVAQALGQALAFAACPIAIWRGDLDLAADLVERCRAYSQRGNLTIFEAWMAGFERAIEAQRLDIDQQVDFRPEIPFGGLKQVDHLATLLPAIVDLSLIQRVEDGEVGWCAPEILRARGEILRFKGDAIGAEQVFRRALILSDAQGATAWRLRTATSLVHLLAPQGRGQEAGDVLAQTLASLTEGRDTRDVRRANLALDSIAIRSRGA